MEYNYVHYGYKAGATELSEQKRSPLVLPRILTQLEFNPTWSRLTTRALLEKDTHLQVDQV